MLRRIHTRNDNACPYYTVVYGWITNNAYSFTSTYHDLPPFPLYRKSEFARIVLPNAHFYRKMGMLHLYARCFVNMEVLQIASIQKE